eukprot:196190_1
MSQKENPYSSKQKENPYSAKLKKNPYSAKQKKNPYSAKQKENPYIAKQKENPYSTIKLHTLASLQITLEKKTTDKDDEKGGMVYKSSSIQLHKSSIKLHKSSIKLHKSSITLHKSSIETLASSIQRRVSSLTLMKVYGRRDDDTIFRILCGVASAVMIVGGAALIYVSGGTSGFVLSAGISLASTGVSKAVDCIIQPKFKPFDFLKDVVIAAGVTVLTFGICEGINQIFSAETDALRQQMFIELSKEATQDSSKLAACVVLNHCKFAIEKIHLQIISDNLKTVLSSLVSNGTYVVECVVNGKNVDVLTLVAKNGTKFVPDENYPAVVSIVVDFFCFVF